MRFSLGKSALFNIILNAQYTGFHNKITCNSVIAHFAIIEVSRIAIGVATVAKSE